MSARPATEKEMASEIEIALSQAIEAVEHLLEDVDADDDPGPGIRTDLTRWQQVLRTARAARMGEGE